jgi:hypothetical protein
LDEDDAHLLDSVVFRTPLKKRSPCCGTVS